MKILITGGAGYIGSVLTPALLNAGHRVTVLDKFTDGGTQLLNNFSNKNFNVVRGDARDTRLLDELMPKYDCFVPLAALVGAPLCKEDTIAAITTNKDAIVDLVLRSTKNQLIIYPTTNSGYGIGQENQMCDEYTPLNPISLYGKTKVEAEEAVLSSGNGVSLRLATVFGLSPKMRLDLLVNDFTWRAVTDKAVILFESNFKRNFIHIRDVANAMLHTINNYAAMRGEVYNLGLSTANLSKLELCVKIKEYVPDFVFIDAPIGEDPDKRNYIVSNAKIEQTGWHPYWSLDDGILELVSGYKTLRNSRYTNV